MTICDDDENARSIDEETLFESYLDRDSGSRSIRRISSRPPPTGVTEAGDGGEDPGCPDLPTD